MRPADDDVSGKTRHIYYGGAVPMIDVFFDKLDYCHEVNYEGGWSWTSGRCRWRISCCRSCRSSRSTTRTSRTSSTCSRWRRSARTTTRRSTPAYVAKRFADDWGFWYTATQLNLPKVKQHCDTVPALSPEQCEHIGAQVDTMLARIEAEPKTKGWEKRAKKGAGKIWYNEGFSDW